MQAKGSNHEMMLQRTSLAREGSLHSSHSDSKLPTPSKMARLLKHSRHNTPPPLHSDETQEPMPPAHPGSLHGRYSSPAPLPRSGPVAWTDSEETRERLTSAWPVSLHGKQNGSPAPLPKVADLGRSVSEEVQQTLRPAWSGSLHGHHEALGRRQYAAADAHDTDWTDGRDVFRGILSASVVSTNAVDIAVFIQLPFCQMLAAWAHTSPCTPVFNHAVMRSCSAKTELLISLWSCYHAFLLSKSKCGSLAAG